jgi:hypothetical protein
MISAAQIGIEFDQLLQDGRNLLASTGWNGNEMQQWPPVEEYLFIRTRAANLIGRVCGEKSPHYQELERVIAEGQRNPYRLPQVVAVLRAARADFDAGLLFNLRALIHAEVLGELLDLAGELASKHCDLAAASLTGAVLEGTLRKLCALKELALPRNANLASLNVKLAKAAVYDKLSQRQIAAYSDLRHSAERGLLAEVKPAEVGAMVEWVRRFASEHLR